MKKIINYCRQIVLLNGIFHGILLTISNIIRKFRSIFYRFVLNAPEINVGPGCKFINIRLINFGKNISIFKSIWIEAVVVYRGKKYSPKIYIGDRVSFSGGVHITAIHRITICNDVLFGSNIYISDHNHGGYSNNVHSIPSEPPSARELISGGEVFIGNNVWVGDNVNIVAPVKIGDGSIIGANSVVRGDIPSNAIVAGSPARIIKIFNESTKLWIPQK